MGMLFSSSRVRPNCESHSSHSGRVSCITMSAQAGMAESVTRARVLHKGAQVHRLYQKHSPEAVQRAVSGGSLRQHLLAHVEPAYLPEGTQRLAAGVPAAAASPAV